MKRVSSNLRKICSFILSMALIVTLFSIVPVVEVAAEAPAYSTAFIHKLLSEHPLAAGQLYVGYGKANITPLAKDSTGYTGVAMGGYGKEQNRIAVVGGANAKVQQDIYSICVAVMDGEGNIVLFDINDIIGAARYTQFRSRISMVTGVPEDKIMISATHTHSGPVANSSQVKIKADQSDYYDYQEKQAAVACAQAIRDLYPADAYIRSVDIVDSNGKNVLNFVRNYDTTGKDYNNKKVAAGNNHGAIRWNGSSWVSNGASNYTTNADPELQLIRFNRADNKNVLMCNFQMHTTLTGKNSSSVISADWVGSFRDAVERECPNYRVALWNGAAGNINPTSDISGDAYRVTNNTGKNITYTFNGKSLIFPKGATIVLQSANTSMTVNGVTLTPEEQRRLASYFCGEKLAEYVTGNLTSSTAYTKVSGSSVKVKNYMFSDYYHAAEDEITTASCRWMTDLLWNSTDAQLKEILIGTFKFTETHLGNMAYINEYVTDAEIQAVKDKTQLTYADTDAGREKATADATIIAKFLKRVQTTINSGSHFYAKGGTYSFYDKDTTEANRFSSTSMFPETIRQYARNSLITWLGGYNQSKDGGSIVIQSPYSANATVSRFNNIGKSYSALLSTISIGDISFTSFPGELFDTNAVFVKENAATKMNFILGYTNGTSGYFPSAYGHLYTCYESDTTPTNQGTSELWAGMQNDFVSDLVFEGDVYQMSVGSTKALTRKDGTALYRSTDSFDYATMGAKYSDNNLVRFSYINKSVTWTSSNTAVATVSSTRVITAQGKGTATITAIHTGGNALSDFTSSASCTVVVGDHNHCDECAQISCTDYSHVKHDFTKWSSTTSLPTAAGRYYLNSNVTLSSPATVNANVVICLNGKKITASGENGAIALTGGTLTICDCKEQGSIYRNGALADGKGLVTVTGGTLKLNSGYIDASEATGQNGVAINCTGQGTVEINGGTVMGGAASNHGSAIYNTGTLKIKGGTVQGLSAANYGGSVYTASRMEMTGGTIEGGMAEYGGALFIGTSNVELSGGLIQGGRATRGGCICIDNYVLLTINGGTIAEGIAQYGGCVFLCTASDIVMNGGTIRDGSTVTSVNSSQGGNVYINANTSSPSSFTMNGGTITGGSCYGLGGNFSVMNGGTLNLNGGTIEKGLANTYKNSNNATSGGHGGNIYNAGILNINGGLITAGMSTYIGGGNISSNASSSKIYMSGGIIKNGSSREQGRGNVLIWNNAAEDCFVMTGGIITDDGGFTRKTGYYGGGVYITDKNTSNVVKERTLNISGSAKITGNILTHTYSEYSATNSFTYCNVYLETGKYVTVGAGAALLVGVTMQGDIGTFSIGGAQSRKNFTSDAGHFVVKDGDNLALAEEADETPDPAPVYVRGGAPSDIPLPNPSGITPEPVVEKDDFTHFAVSVGESFSFTSKFSGVTAVTKTSQGGAVTLSGTSVIGTANGAETFTVTCSQGTVKCVVAVGHYHCLECGTFGCQVHQNYLFTAKSDFDIGATGNYYIAQDISEAAMAQILSDKTVRLCLNGYTVNGKTTDRLLNIISTRATLSITDCSADESGKLVSNACEDDEDSEADGYNEYGGLAWITSGNTLNVYRGTLDASNVVLQDSTSLGLGANIYLNGTLNMYGGTLTGGAARRYGGCIYMYYNGLINMYGGTITGGSGTHGGVLTMRGNSTSKSALNIYGGVIDASNVTDITYGGAIYNEGIINITNGTIIGGNPRTYGGGISNRASGEITMNGGTIDCYNVFTGGASAVYNYGNFTMNNGRIIGGTQTGSSYYGAIYCYSSSTFTLNDGVIQDGTGIYELTVNSEGVISGKDHSAGNLFLASSGTTFNMNGGIIANGVAYGNGGNVYMYYGTLNITGGLITGGKAFATHPGAPMGRGTGGNIFHNGGTVNMSGGTIEGGQCDNSYGGNVSVFETNAVFNMSGGTIKNGAAYSGGGNVTVWYHAGKLDGSKIAFNMTGGTITDDEDFVPPAGLYAGGLLLVPNGDNGYHNRVLISGSPVIKGNKEYNLLVSSGDRDELIIDELNADSDLNVTLNAVSRFAHDVPAQSLPYIKTDEYTKNYIFSYDSETGRLDSVYSNNSFANNYIASYLTAPDGHYLTDPLSEDASILEMNGALNVWNSLGADQQTELNNIFASKSGVSDIGTLLNTAHTYAAERDVALAFLNNYFSGTDGYYTEVTLANCTLIASSAAAWVNLTSSQKQVANAILGTPITPLIATAQNLAADKSAAQNFLNNYFKQSGNYYSSVTVDNYAQIAAAATPWGNLTTAQKELAEQISGVGVGALITEAVEMQAQIAADTAAAEAFVASYLTDGQGGYYDMIDADNYQKVASGKSEYNSLSATVKQLIDGIIGASAAELINEADGYNPAADAALLFVNNYFSIEGDPVTGVDIDNFTAVDALLENGAEEQWTALTEKQQAKANLMISKAGATSTVAELIALAKEYIRMLSVNVIVSDNKKDHIFYAGIDNADDYECAGFIIDYGYAVTELYTTGVLTDSDLPADALSVSEISGAAQYAFACDYLLYKRDYNKSATVCAFVRKKDGSYVYGKETVIRFREPADEMNKHESNEITGTDTDYNDSDFGL